MRVSLCVVGCARVCVRLACAMFFRTDPCPPKHSRGIANLGAIRLRYTYVGLAAPPGAAARMWEGWARQARLQNRKKKKHGAPGAAGQAETCEQNGKEGFKHQVPRPKSEACSQKLAKKRFQNSPQEPPRYDVEALCA